MAILEIDANVCYRLRDLKGDWHEYESKMERRKEREKDNAKRKADSQRRREERAAKEKERAEAAAGKQEYDPTRVIEASKEEGIATAEAA